MLLSESSEVCHQHSGGLMLHLRAGLFQVMGSWKDIKGVSQPILCKANWSWLSVWKGIQKRAFIISIGAYLLHSTWEMNLRHGHNVKWSQCPELYYDIELVIINWVPRCARPYIKTDSVYEWINTFIENICFIKFIIKVNISFAPQVFFLDGKIARHW